MAIYSSDGTKIAESKTDIVLPNPEEVQQLKCLADSLKEEVELVKKEATQAKNTAFWSKVFSVISIAIALGSLIVAILALVFR